MISNHNSLDARYHQFPQINYSYKRTVGYMTIDKQTLHQSPMLFIRKRLTISLPNCIVVAEVVCVP